MAGDGSRRAAILDAALGSFLTHGLAGASIEDIRARCGASVGSIYHHFGGKEGVAGAVYVAALAGYQAAFRAALDAHPGRALADTRAGVRGAVRAHLRWCLTDRPDQARFLLFAGDAARTSATDELRGRNREFFAAVLGWWRPRVALGQVRELDLDVVYALWLGPAQEYCRLRLAGRGAGGPGDEDELADGAWRALRAGRGPGAGRAG